MDLAAVHADRPLAEERIVGGRLLHLGDDLGPVVGLGRLHRLEVVQGGRVHAGVDHRGMDAAVALGEALGEGPGLVVGVPVEGLGEDQPLGLVEPEGVHVGEEHEEAGEVLAALDDAELRPLLDGVGGVAARVGQPDDLGLGGLRLQQERREVLGVEGMAHLAQHLAAALEHHGLGVALERVPEGVVRGEEEPRVAARLHDGAARPVGQGPRVVGPVHGVGRAGLAREVGGGGARHQKRLALVAGDLVDGQGHARVGHVHDHVHLVGVVPLASDLGAHVGLVLVVGGDDLDLQALLGGLEVLDGHAGGDHRALPGEIGVEARLVVEHADLDDAVGDLRERGSGREGQGRERGDETVQMHVMTPFPVVDARGGYTPRYSCSLSMLAARSRLRIRSTTRPCSIT